MNLLVFSHYWMKSSPLLAGVIVLGLLAENVLAAADQYQSHTSIQNAARDFIIENADLYPVPPKVDVGRIDPRLRLTQCAEKLQAFAPPGHKRTGRITVGVRCAGRRPWSLYVPLTVSLMGDAVVATRDLLRGDLITATDVSLVQQDLARLHSGYLNALERAVGKRVKRTIRQGSVIKPTQIASSALIRKGAEVTITASSDRISVKTKGKALSSGGLGERIRVRNLRSNKVLEATVVSAGVVKVDF